MKYRIVLLLTLGCFTMSSCRANDKINKEQAIEIAKHEVVQLGYDLDTMDVKVSFWKTPMNEYLRDSTNSSYIIERKKKLVGKKYWAIYFYPKEMVLGGDVCIFVNSTSGDIITNIRGK